MKLRETFWTLAVALVICVPSVHAQDPKQAQQTGPSAPIPPLESGTSGGYPGKPVPAARGVSPSYDPGTYDPSQVTPDQNTLAGAESFGIGSLSHSHNTFDPSASVSILGQSIPETTGHIFSGILIPGGAMDFDRTWSKYHFTTLYTGGETFDLVGPNNQGQISTHSQFHDLIVTQQIDWARLHILLRDDFIASPGAAFTGTGMGGPGLIAQYSYVLGTTLNSVGQEFVPSDSIETGIAMRYRNAVLAQAEYSLSRRSTLTFSGSYGILHFSAAGYISSQMVDAQAGYDYLLNPTDSIALLASYGKIQYTGTVNSTLDYMAALAYGKKITGHLAFQVAAGPQQIRSTVGNTSYSLWFPSVNSGMTYDRRRSGLNASFTRGLSSGSGVFLGATSNTFSGSAHYLFTRFWTGTVTGGYALNDSLAPAGSATTRFDTWFVGANLGRLLSRQAQINFNYGLQRQNNPNICPVVSCGVTGFQQTFGMTVNWHLRPVG